MLTYSLKGTGREAFGKKAAKAIRKNEETPCVIYSHGKTTHFNINTKEILKAICSPETFLINLEIDGKVLHALIQNTAFHPVHDVLHSVEFIEVEPDKLITVKLPVKLTGTSPGVLAGGKLVPKARQLKVRGFYKDLPSHVEASISELRLGKTLKAGDLSFPNFAIMMNKDLPIASIEITRALRQEAQQAAGKK